MNHRTSILRAVGVVLLAVTPAPADSTVIDRSDYASKLRGMWLGQVIANWTGRQTEGHMSSAPFYTDANWGTMGMGGPIDYVFQSPWGADDDTDIEYTYIHLLNQHNTTTLTPQQIADGWTNHINDYIWVSNYRARELIGRGVMPDATSIPAANTDALMIDAQLTTEVFGALAPAMPNVGLNMGLLPMLTTSRGHATHASQYFATLYSLAPIAPANLTNPQKLRWMSDQAREFIPDTSKAADIIDFVTADFDANPDVNDWELTRDRIYDRYQLHAGQNGFAYRAWFESSVNLATGVMALLYGQGDFNRTVQIGTLGGWDSDNPTATLGGLLGLLYGDQAIEDAFPQQNLSDRFWIERTRDNFPDYLPGDPAAEDTFTMMSTRMLDIIDRAVTQAGGQVNLAADTWTIDAPDLSNLLDDSPTRILQDRSANNWVRKLGGSVTASSAVNGQPVGSNAAIFADGVEYNFSGVEWGGGILGVAHSTASASNQAGDSNALTVLYSQDVRINTVHFIEGDFQAGLGGWFDSLTLELLVNNTWQAAPAGTIQQGALDPDVPFEFIDFVLPSPLQVKGVRLTGPAGGSQGWITTAELDAWVALLGDFDSDIRVSADDIDLLFDAIEQGGVVSLYDVNADGQLNSADMSHEVEQILATSFGDSDLDGDVDLADLGALATHYGAASGAGWASGDFDGDNDVDLADLGVLATYYGAGSQQALADFQSLVPEPISWMWIALMGIGKRSKG